ncbi:MAG: glycosyltransferase family 4 protein [Candidatus Latescibacterota bacterium]
MPLKIGMVTEYYFPHLGGMTEHVYNVSRRLTSNGYTVKVITSHIGASPPTGARDSAGTEIIRIGRSMPLLVNGSVGRISVGFGLRKKIREMLEREKFDLLHVHSPTVFTLPVFTLLEANCPCIGTYHTYFEYSMLYALLKDILQKRAVNKLDGHIAVSQTSIDAMRRYFTLNPRIIPNGVDTEVFNPSIAPVDEFRDGKKNLLFMGRFDPRNGLDFMIRTFCEVKSRYRNVRLIVVGDGPFGAYYRYLVPREYREDVLFEGTAWERRPQYYAACDVFCSPVTRASFGVTLVEAMASGKPIVATENTGYREVLSGREGIMVPRGDVNGFADAILRLLRNDDLRIRMGNSGRRKSLRYSWDRVTDEIVDFYLETLERRVCRMKFHGIGIPAFNGVTEEMELP